MLIVFRAKNKAACLKHSSLFKVNGVYLGRDAAPPLSVGIQGWRRLRGLAGDFCLPWPDTPELSKESAVSVPDPGCGSGLSGSASPRQVGPGWDPLFIGEPGSHLPLPRGGKVRWEIDRPLSDLVKKISVDRTRECSVSRDWIPREGEEIGGCFPPTVPPRPLRWSNPGNGGQNGEFGHRTSKMDVRWATPQI